MLVIFVFPGSRMLVIFVFYIIRWPCFATAQELDLKLHGWLPIRETANIKPCKNQKLYGNHLPRSPNDTWNMNMYSGTCLASTGEPVQSSTRWRMKISAGLAGCWINEVRL